MMKLIRNEKGVALVMVIIIALIGLAMVSTLLFMVTQGTRISGFQKVYRTTDEAGLGGAQIATQFITNNMINLSSGMPLTPIAAGWLRVFITNGNPDACLNDKLTLTRGAWDTADPKYFWSNCAGARALAIDADQTPDFTFCTNSVSEDCSNPIDATIPNFKVYTKIIDTVRGNTGVGLGGGKLGGAGVVSTMEGEITPPPIPSLYRIEVQAQDATNPQQRSKYSVLYAH